MTIIQEYLIKRTTKGKRPRPREPRVWSTSQQSPPSLWSALNKVIIIIIIIIITTSIITINIIFTHAQIQIQIFRKCVRVQQEGKEFLWANCRLLQVGAMFTTFFLHLFSWLSEQDPVVANDFFYRKSFVWIRLTYKIKLRAHFGPVYALQRNPCFPKVITNMSGLW